MGAGGGGGRAGAGGGGAGSERRGAERGRAQKPSRRRRACPAAELPRSLVFIEMQIARGCLSPRRGRGVQGCPPSPSGSPGIRGGGWRWLCRGDKWGGGRPGHTQPGETAWRGHSGARRHPISEPGEWAHFRKRHEGTHGRRGGQGTSSVHLLSFSLTRVNFRNHLALRDAEQSP